MPKRNFSSPGDKPKGLLARCNRASLHLREVLNAQRLANGQPADATATPSGEWRPVEHLAHRASSEDIAFLQYTSGSTGDPKGVILTHANLLANIQAIIGGINIQSDDVAVSWLPLYHDMGLIGAWFVPIVTGIPLVVMSPLAFLSRPDRWLWAIHNHRGTISPAPNFAYELCVRKVADKDIEGLDLSSWRAATNGAEPVAAATLERFVARFTRYGFHREALMPVYGLAEACLGVSAPPLGSGFKVDRIERAALESNGRAIPAKPDDKAPLEFVGAGKPMPGVEVRIVDKEKNERALGERAEGQLQFRGASATSGYYRNPAATRELIHEGGWLDSGDLAYWADGEIYITGRAKDVIIKAGRNIYPHEVEEIAGRVSGVRTGCVVAFGAPDERTGTEKLIVAAEVRDMSAAKRISGEIAQSVSEAMGVPAGHRRAASAAIHSENFERQASPQRNKAPLPRRQSRQKTASGVGAGGAPRSPQRRSACVGVDESWNETHLRSCIRRLRTLDFWNHTDRAMDCRLAHFGSRASGANRALGLAADPARSCDPIGNRARRITKRPRDVRPLDFCAQSFELRGYFCGARVASARCALRRERRSARYAAHRQNHPPLRPARLRPQRSRKLACARPKMWKKRSAAASRWPSTRKEPSLR